MLSQTPSLMLFWLTGSITLVWLLLLSLLMVKQQQFFKQFTQGVTKKDLKSSLQAISQSLKSANTDISEVHNQLATMQKDNQLHLQKQGFVRFNPYADTGGNQSFCLCLLNDYNNGIVITSLHSREQTRIYAKTITQGENHQSELSKEEKEAVAQAMRS